MTTPDPETKPHCGLLLSIPVICFYAEFGMVFFLVPGRASHIVPIYYGHYWLLQLLLVDCWLLDGYSCDSPVIFPLHWLLLLLIDCSCCCCCLVLFAIVVVICCCRLLTLLVTRPITWPPPNAFPFVAIGIYWWTVPRWPPCCCYWPLVLTLLTTGWDPPSSPCPALPRYSVGTDRRWFVVVI